MIIIEGTDKLGKTRLAKAIVKAANEDKSIPWPAIYSHFTKLPDDKWDYFKHYIAFMNPYVVMDRFHLSEVAYGIVCRGRTLITPSCFKGLEAVLDLCPAITVTLVGSEQYLEQQWKAEERDEMFPREKCFAVNEAFHVISGVKPDYNPVHLSEEQVEELNKYSCTPNFYRFIDKPRDYPSEDKFFVKAIINLWKFSVEAKLASR